MTSYTSAQIMITILALTAGTVATRVLPFLIFPAGKPVPAFIDRLQTLLPSAVIGLLAVYCLRSVNVLAGTRGMPELVAIAALALVHIWRGNTLLSIAAGTAAYMVLVQFIFV